LEFDRTGKPTRINRKEKKSKILRGLGHYDDLKRKTNQDSQIQKNNIVASC
jgi:hypothetical protein